MSTPFSRIAALLLASTALLHAEAPAPAASSDAVPPYQLKRRSTCDAGGVAERAPFWPIGWVKRQPGGAVVQTNQAAPAPLVAVDEKDFKVTSILLGVGTTPSLAVINGRAYSEGEYVRMPRSGATAGVKIRVQRINDGHVILQNSGQMLVASLLRPELSARRGEEMLLDPDR